MPHKPSSPADAQSADPVRGDQAPTGDEARHVVAATASSDLATSRWPRYAAGAAIGSAAVAAALLYYNRKGAD